MSSSNTHHIPAFYHVFGSFHIIISVAIALYLITRLLVHFRGKDGIWRLCGDLEKKIGEPSPNVATLPRLNQ